MDEINIFGRDWIRTFIGQYSALGESIAHYGINMTNTYDKESVIFKVYA